MQPLSWDGVITGIVGVLIGFATILTYFRITKMSNETSINVAKMSELASLRSELHGLLTTTMSYPYFYDINFIDQYKTSVPPLTHEEIRYQTFCYTLMNLVERTYIFFDGEMDEVNKFCNCDEVVYDHRFFLIKNGIVIKNTYDKRLVSHIFETIRKREEEIIHISSKPTS